MLHSWYPAHGKKFCGRNWEILMNGKCWTSWSEQNWHIKSIDMKGKITSHMGPWMSAQNFLHKFNKFGKLRKYLKIIRIFAAFSKDLKKALKFCWKKLPTFLLMIHRQNFHHNFLLMIKKFEEQKKLCWSKKFLMITKNK